MSAQDNARLANELYEAFNRGDLNDALALSTEDIEVEVVAFAQTFTGHQGFADFMNGFKTTFPDLTVTIVNQVATDDQVVSECTWTGTHSGPLASPTGDIPPTGRRVEHGRFCEVWRIRNGKLASIRNYQDAVSWFRELGLIS